MWVDNFKKKVPFQEAQKEQEEARGPSFPFLCSLAPCLAQSQEVGDPYACSVCLVGTKINLSSLSTPPLASVLSVLALISSPRMSHLAAEEGNCAEPNETLTPALSLASSTTVFMCVGLLLSVAVCAGCKQCRDSLRAGPHSCISGYLYRRVSGCCTLCVLLNCVGTYVCVSGACVWSKCQEHLDEQTRMLYN